jgi:hypothetical protein
MPGRTVMPGRTPLGLLAVLAPAYLWLFVWADQVNNPNENVRLYATRALAEHGTYAIARRDLQQAGDVQGVPTGDGFRDKGPVYDDWGWVNDKAIRCDDPRLTGPACPGWLYPGKAPGLAYLGAPPLLILRGFWRYVGWGVPDKAAITWWLRVCVAIVPTILAWLWLARHLMRRLNQAELGLAVVLTGALGSLSLTYGQMFAGHQPATLALLLAFAATVRAGDGPTSVQARAGYGASAGWWVALAGFAAAWAPAIEYPAGPAAVMIVLWLLLRRRQWRDVPWLALGAALPVGLVAHYHTVAFGAPWALPYAFLENPGFQQDIAPGLFGIHWPTWEKIAGSLASPFTGLWFFAPWTALLFVGLWGLKRAPLPTGEIEPNLLAGRRGEAAVALAVCAYLLWFQCSHSLWRGGWVVGPRYITAIVPFAAIAIAHGLDSLPERARPAWLSAFVATALAAIAVTGLCTAVTQGFPFDFFNPLPEAVAPLLAHGWIGDNLLMRWGIPGPWSGLPYFAALLAGAAWLVVLVARAAGPGARWSVAVVGVFAGLALVGLQWQVGPGRTARSDRTVQWMTSVWSPPHPPGGSPIVPP